MSLIKIRIVCKTRSQKIKISTAISTPLVFFKFYSRCLTGTAFPSYQPVNGKLLLQATTTFLFEVGVVTSGVGEGVVDESK